MFTFYLYFACCSDIFGVWHEFHLFYSIACVLNDVYLNFRKTVDFFLNFIDIIMFLYIICIHLISSDCFCDNSSSFVSIYFKIRVNICKHFKILHVFCFSQIFCMDQSSSGCFVFFQFNFVYIYVLFQRFTRLLFDSQKKVRFFF